MRGRRKRNSSHEGQDIQNNLLWAGTVFSVVAPFLVLAGVFSAWSMDWGEAMKDKKEPAEIIRKELFDPNSCCNDACSSPPCACANDIIAALSKDYAIVPRKPTEGMIDAWEALALKRIKERLKDDNNAPGTRAAVRENFKAMIEAWEKEGG